MPTKKNEIQGQRDVSYQNSYSTRWKYCAWNIIYGKKKNTVQQYTVVSIGVGAGKAVSMVNKVQIKRKNIKGVKLFFSPTFITCLTLRLQAIHKNKDTKNKNT